MKRLILIMLLLASACAIHADWFDLSLQGGPSEVWMQAGDGMWSASGTGVAAPDGNFYSYSGGFGPSALYREIPGGGIDCWTPATGWVDIANPGLGSWYFMGPLLGEFAHYEAGGSPDVPPSWLSAPAAASRRISVVAGKIRAASHRIRTRE